MWIAEAIPPAGPLWIPALVGLFVTCACIVLIGMIKSIDAVVRAFFGTVNGAVSWIPYANKVVQHANHKVEQKISHALGSAEHKLDGYIALSWHHTASLYRFLAHEISGGAVTAWHLAQQAQAFVRQRDVSHAVRSGVAPVRSQVANVSKAQAHDHAQTRALHHSVAQGVYPRLRAAENEITHVLEPDIAALRARTKALERGAVRTFDWIRAHPLSLATTAFAGAVAVALTKIGGGWIRCKNWRAIGKHVCSLPWTLIEGLLGLGLAFAVVIDPRKTAEAAVAVEDAMESLIRKIAD